MTAGAIATGRERAGQEGQMYVGVRRITVEWGDCDPSGIVFNPRYFEWFDAATAGSFADVGIDRTELHERFDYMGMPMVETRARFHRPSTWGDQLVLETRLCDFKRSSFRVEHRLLKGDELVVEGFETRVWVAADSADPTKVKSRPIPAELIEIFMSGPDRRIDGKSP